MYFSTSTKKLFNFTVIIVALLICVVITSFIRSTQTGEYISTSWFSSSIRVAWNTAIYKAKASSEGGLLASIVQFFSPTETGNAANGSALAHDVPALLYHGITDQPGKYNVTDDQFWEHMKELKDDGWQTITLKDFEEYMNGQKNLPEKSFLLTFDDGRTDSYIGADPVLRALGFNAVMFTPTYETIESPEAGFNSYYLNEPTLRLMISSGRWEIGSHAVQNTPGGRAEGLIPTGPDRSGYLLSNKMWLADQGRLETDEEYRSRIEHELIDSKKRLEDVFGIPIRSFSYPFSDFGQRSENNLENAAIIIEEIVESNYTMAFQQTSPRDNNFASNFPGTDPAHLRRIEPDSDWSADFLIQKLNSSQTKTLPFDVDFGNSIQWLYNWGLVSISGQAMHLQAASDSSGVFTFLDGTYNWGDYIYTVSGRWEEGSDLSLIARYQNGDNYAACVFRDGEVRIIEVVDGQRKKLREADSPVILPRSNLTLAVHVSGQTIRCYEGSRIAANSSRLNEKLNRGGIALSVWNNDLDKASATIVSLTAVPSDDADQLQQQLPTYANKAPLITQTPFPKATSTSTRTPSPSPQPSESVPPIYITPTPEATPTPSPTPSPTITPTPTFSPTPTSELLDDLLKDDEDKDKDRGKDRED